MPKSFSLHRRGSIYYAQLWNPETKRFASARSTETTDRDDALLMVSKWLRDGIPVGRTGTRRPVQELMEVDSIISTIRRSPLTADDGTRIAMVLKELGLIDSAIPKGRSRSEPFIPFLLRFWDYNTSPYIREKLAHGQRIGRRHAMDMTYRVLDHWKNFFEGTNLADVTKSRLREFSLHLADKKLAASTINKSLIAGITALKWAFENDLISHNPALGIRRFSGIAAKRGILDIEEVVALFKMKWPDQRAYVANLVAATTGLRLGEVIALQVRDIGEDRLYIRHSWSDKDGLKSPKNGEERNVALLPEVRSTLLSLANTNPFGVSPTTYIFYGRYAEKPIDGKVMGRELNDMLIKLIAGDKANPTTREAAA